jgi:protein arginine kinase
MFHFIGLAQAKRLPAVLLAVAEKGLAARGLFGEASRAVGAFVQISIIHDSFADFVGACEYLIKEERAARQLVTRASLLSRTDQTLSFARSKRSITLGDALRVLAWMRWASDAGIAGAPASVRDVDLILTKLDLRSMVDAAEADEQRADFLRKALGL